MVSASKSNSTQSSKGGEASANYMIRGAGRSKAARSKSTQKESSVVGKLKKKVKNVQDKVVDSADKATDATTRKVRSTTDNSTNNRGKNYEEGSAGTISHKVRDPTKDYEANEPMSPAKIKQHEPTAVRRNPKDQKIIESE